MVWPRTLEHCPTSWRTCKSTRYVTIGRRSRQAVDEAAPSAIRRDAPDLLRRDHGRLIRTKHPPSTTCRSMWWRRRAVVSTSRSGRSRPAFAASNQLDEQADLRLERDIEIVGPELGEPVLLDDQCPVAGSELSVSLKSAGMKASIFLTGSVLASHRFGASAPPRSTEGSRGWQGEGRPCSQRTCRRS